MPPLLLISTLTVTLEGEHRKLLALTGNAQAISPLTHLSTLLAVSHTTKPSPFSNREGQLSLGSDTPQHHSSLRQQLWPLSLRDPLSGKGTFNKSN